ncbi:phytase [Sphingomonas sp. UYAg733]
MDRIEIVAGDFGPAYPGGILVAQDGVNAPRAQNFKLVSRGEINAALGPRSAIARAREGA